MRLSGLLSSLATATLFSVATLVSAQTATAPVAVQGAWIRSTVAGQQATGAFMRLTAHELLRLVQAQSSVAGVVEIHQMKMEGNVMKMYAVPSIELTPREAVSLQPGSYHIMLMDLKTLLAPNTKVPLTLIFENTQGTQSQLQLEVPVSLRAPGSDRGSHTPAGHSAAHSHGS